LSSTGKVSFENLQKDAKMCNAVITQLLHKLQSQKRIYLDADGITINEEQRLNLATQAVALGVDPQRVSNLLKWQEFEHVCALTLENNNYETLRNLRFTHSNRRFEIDIIGCKRPLVLCIDCKQWRHGLQGSRAETIITAQLARTMALADTLPNPAIKIECTKWSNAYFIPVVLSLTQNTKKLLKGIPIVPVLQLQNFLQEVWAHMEELAVISKKYAKLA
jgi:Holliday junction resolvase-like predicted endonuclease